MQTISFKKKIPKYLFISLLILFAYFLYTGFNKYQEKRTYDDMHKYIHFTKLSSDLIHELQKERGYSTGFRASYGKSFAKELKKQRDETDKYIKLLDNFLDIFHYHVYKFSFNEPIKELVSSLSKINIHRQKIDNHKINSSEIMDYYTNNIGILIKLIEYIPTISNNAEVNVLAQSYITLIKIKEKAGVERALINNVFSKGKLSNKEFYEFGKLVAAQDIYIKYFKSISDKKYIDILSSTLYKDGRKDINRDRSIVYAKNKKNEILSDIKGYIGYGGLIHNFKNYVIRGQDKYKLGVDKQYNNLILAIDKYKQIDGVTKEELELLKIIKGVFLEYKNGLDEVAESFKNNGSIRALDKVVKVDDNPALEAINQLTTNIYGSQEDWFEHSTYRINSFKKLANILSSDLNTLIDSHSNDLMIRIVIQLIIILVVLVIVFLLFSMLRSLIESEKVLSMAQENTKSGSYEYYVKENYMVWSDEHYKLLDVDKKFFKPSLRTFNIFIHPDDRDIVESGMNLAIKSRKISFYDYRVILYDNSIKYVRSSAEVIKYNKHNEPLVIMGTIVDVTEFKKLEQEIVDTQKDVIFTMGAIGETRSKETGLHVKRVAEYSKLLYLLNGASNYEAELLKMASPMHDIGKVGIPDNILNKPGKLTPAEWAIMQTHAEMGYEMLKNSHREILQLAATVSLTHHEKYDGSGYPKGLLANEIPLVGRITALADVFDALGSDRCYKVAWELDDIIALIKQERSKHFDPKLVDLFLENLDKFLEIRDKYKDIT